LEYIERVLGCALEEGCGISPNIALSLCYEAFQASELPPPNNYSPLHHPPFQQHLHSILTLLIKHNLTSQASDDSGLSFMTLAEFLSRGMVSDQWSVFPEEDKERLACQLDLGSPEEPMVRASIGLTIYFLSFDPLAFQRVALVFGRRMAESATFGLQHSPHKLRALIIRICRFLVQKSEPIFHQSLEISGFPQQLVHTFTQTTDPLVICETLSFLLAYLGVMPSTVIASDPIRLVDTLVADTSRLHEEGLTAVLNLIAQQVSFLARDGRQHLLIDHLQHNPRQTIFLVHLKSHPSQTIRARLDDFVNHINQFIEDNSVHQPY
jgi:hypothetical protein